MRELPGPADALQLLSQSDDNSERLSSHLVGLCSAQPCTSHLGAEPSYLVPLSLSLALNPLSFANSECEF